MKNTKQKASIQSMNNDNLNIRANNEGKGNTPGCRRINYNELYRKSITNGNEMQHVWFNMNFKLPQLSIDMTCLRHLTRGYTSLLNGRVALTSIAPAGCILVPATGFLACITWTEKARQHQ